MARTLTKIELKKVFRFKRALDLIWQSAPSWTAASAFILLFQSLLALATLYLTKLVIDAVNASLVSSDKGFAFSRIAMLIAIAGVIALLIVCCRTLGDLVRDAQAQIVTDHVQGIIHSKSIEVDLEYYENPQYFDTLYRAQQEATYRPTRIVNSLLQIGQSGLSLLGIIGLLVSFQWIIALVLVLGSIPGIFVRLKYAGKLYDWQIRSTPLERMAYYLHWMLVNDTHAKEIRLFDLGTHFKEQFSNLRKKLRAEKLNIGRSRAFANLLAQTSSTLAVFGSYAFIALSTVQGTITLGDLVMYYAAFQQGQSFLEAVLSDLVSLHEDDLFLTGFYDFLDLKPKIAEPSHPDRVPKPMQRGITFDHVSFQYPDNEKKILKDISLDISPGKTVALVGENGSGKTTIIKLLCRLYDPTEGMIAIDGIDLRRFQTKSLRREISVIFQDYSHYYLTAKENIWFGDVNRPLNQLEIKEAAQCSGADNVISQLAKSYDTILGNWFEGGEELSTGEWQKIALARAFLRNAQIIVLDEPTSSIDAKAEDEILRKFRELAAGKTSILIAHRLSTVKMADCIYFLKDGTIVEKGTHDELICRQGDYARFFEIQAKHYR